MHIQTKIYKPSTGLNNNCSTDKVLPYYIKVFFINCCTVVAFWLSWLQSCQAGYRYIFHSQ